MILSGSSISLQAVLAGAITTSQPECHVDYIDYQKDGLPTTPATYRSALNSTTDVSILPAPTFNPTREVLNASIYNKDTASVTVTVKTDDGTTERIIAKTTLLTLETFCYEKGQGWYALDANGNRKEVTSSVFSSLTVTGQASFGNDVTVSGLITSVSASRNALLMRLTATGGESWDFTNTNTSGSTDVLNIGTQGGTANLSLRDDGLVTANAGLSVTGVGLFTGTIKSGGYTVATLPANSAGLIAYVTDQLTAAAAKGVAPTGGGAVTCYVMNTGAGWVGI